MIASSVANRKSVAIIGGGVAGLSCAERLATSADVTVFDTGRLRPGGRCSSRQPNDVPKDSERPKNFRSKPLLSTVRFDHAAQIITIPKWEETDPASFVRQLEQWETSGLVDRFPDTSVYTIRSHKNIKPMGGEMYYGTQGMGSIPESIVRSSGGSFTVNQDVWVSPSNGVKFMPQQRQWRVQAGGKVLGVFDSLVIAHNGKCADRLMSKTPAKDLHSLLRVNFSPSVPSHGGKRMTLNSIYSLTVVLPRDNLLSRTLPSSFIAGFVQNHPSLRFITCQTRKYPSAVDETGDVEMETWTILSSSTFAKKHKAPQEFLSDETIETVTELLLSAVEEAVTGENRNHLWGILDLRLQLWGAALPLNVWRSEQKPAGFVYDAEYKAGACGDWLLEASIAGAWTSGRLLAEHMLSEAAPTSHGLQGDFYKSETVAKAGIAAIVS